MNKAIVATLCLIGIAPWGSDRAVIQAGEEPRKGGETAAKVDFNFQIRPILSDKCYSCHGPDPRDRKAKLRLDTREGLFAERPSGDRPVVPGDLESSLIAERISSDDPTLHMPPPTFGRPLEPAEVEQIKRWIAQGAKWRPHWAFSPPDAERPPATRRQGWVRNAIDEFVIARLETEGLAPAPEADRGQLIRRLTLDLTGLPPTLAEIEAFTVDQSPDAYDRLVERLLASPRFGERMAADWLDLARYADTHGYQADVYRAMWPYRDWVVNAWNQGMPFDQFLTWQLAGDLLPSGPRDRILATAFNRCHRQTNEGGSIEEEFRAEYVADRVNTFAATFLGMTLECARCHDHKYDPVTQKDYYQLSAFFNNIDESGLYSHFTTAVPTPTLLLSTNDQDQAIAELTRRVDDDERALESLQASRRPAFETWLRTAVEPSPSPGLIGDFPLDAIVEGKVTNLVPAGTPGQVSEAPEIVAGKLDHALRLSGENGVTLPVGNFDRFEPFSLAMWIKTPDVKERAVVIHRSMAWTDAGSRGYQLLIEEGKLSVALIHFWPGDAVAIRAREPLPLDRWVHVAVRYDGSSRARGLALDIDGKPARCDVIRDNLARTIKGGGNDHLTIGQRFRDRGFKGGSVDAVKVFDRELAPLEIARLAGVGAAVSNHEQLWRYYMLVIDAEARVRRDRLRASRERLARLVDAIPEIMVMKDLSVQRPTYILRRGAYDAPGERVEPGVPASLGTFRPDWPRNRLGLAKWLLAPDHPLTARVAVNRMWQLFFGRGIVATPEDFGSQGQLPSHPELLDHLARSLIDSGWDMKRLARVIVGSATYRRDSRVTAELLTRDPENALLARGPRFRLSAEMIRDSALQSSGLLIERLGGPPVKPYEPPGLWEEKSGTPYVRDTGSASHRRSLYTFWKRTSPPPSMLAFDAVSREVCVVRRQTTATPLQALVLLNDPQFVETARGLAERSMIHGGSTLADQVAHAFRLALGRPADAREMGVLLALYNEQLAAFQAGREDPRKLIAVGDLPPDRSLDPARLAAMTVLAQALYSHDEFVMNR